EQVAVSIVDRFSSEARGRIGKVEIDRVSASHSISGVAAFLDRARGDVTRDQIPERGIAALQEIVAVRVGDLSRRARVPFLLRNPDASVVAERLAHQSELGLALAVHRNAGGMDLREAGVREA